MYRTLLASTLLALTTGTLALADPQMVKKVEVVVDATAIDNAKAAAHWLALASDLNAAIVLRLGNQMADNGARVLIDLSHVELANTWQTTFGIAESRLVGDVIVRNADSDVEMRRYELTVSFADAGPFFPKGADMAALTSDSPEYYQAMVNAFADRVVTNLN